MCIYRPPSTDIANHHGLCDLISHLCNIHYLIFTIHYKISDQSYVKIESHIDYSIFYELS